MAKLEEELLEVEVHARQAQAYEEALARERRLRAARDAEQKTEEQRRHSSLATFLAKQSAALEEALMEAMPDGTGTGTGGGGGACGAGGAAGGGYEERILAETALDQREDALRELMTMLPESPRDACRSALEACDFNVDAAACELLVDERPQGT